MLTPVTLLGMVNIRVGVSGRNGGAFAGTVGDVMAAHLILWVEIDGQRIEGATLTGISGNWNGSGFHTTSVEFIGLPEFVYHGKDGQPLE